MVSDEWTVWDLILDGIYFSSIPRSLRPLHPYITGGLREPSLRSGMGSAAPLYFSNRSSLQYQFLLHRYVACCAEFSTIVQRGYVQRWLSGDWLISGGKPWTMALASQSRYTPFKAICLLLTHGYFFVLFSLKPLNLSRWPSQTALIIAVESAALNT